MNCYRLIEGFVVHVNTPGGAVGYLGALAPWHHVFKDTLYATQEILGDAVAVRVSCPSIETAFDIRSRRLIIFPDLPDLDYMGAGLENHSSPDDAIHRQLW